MINQALVRLRSFILSFDFLVIMALVIYSVFVWLPTYYLPFHWDSAGFAIQAAHAFVTDGFNPWLALFSDFAQTPLFVSYIALVWRIWGGLPTVMHIAMFPFLPLFLVSTYYFSERLTGSKLLGVISAFLVGMTPIVVAEYGQIYLDLPAAAFVSLGLALWVRKHYQVAVIIFAVAFFVKVSSILVIPFLLGWLYVYERKHASFLPMVLRTIGVLITSAVLWFVYHFMQTGWLFTRPGRSVRIPQTFGMMSQSWWFVFKEFVWSYSGSWFLIVLLLCLMILFFQGKKVSRAVVTTKMLLLLGFLFIVISFFAFGGEYAERYGLFALPALITLLVWLTQRMLVLVNRSWSTFWFLSLSLLFALRLVTLWHPDQATTSDFQFRPAHDLGYQDVIFTQRSMAYYIEHVLTKPRVYGSFPENLYLTQPYQGYVTEAQDFTLCSEFSYSAGEEQVIYYHPYSPGQIGCMNLLSQLTVEQVVRYERNGSWVELYRVTGIPEEAASAAAALNI